MIEILQEEFMNTDVIVDEVRRVRDKLVKRHGGLDGWIAHLQEMDRERNKQRVARKSVASNGKKRRKRPAKTRVRRGS
jgi:hypothetical protein